MKRHGKLLADSGRIGIIIVTILILITIIRLVLLVENDRSGHVLLTKYTPFAKPSITYDIEHETQNNPTPRIDYSKLPRTTQRNYLHVDSYQVKNRQQIYFDSLLERYAYFYPVYRDEINSYIGSHGVVSYRDPITQASLMKPLKYTKYVALSTGSQYSNLSMNYDDLIKFANQARFYCLYKHAGKAPLLNWNTFTGSHMPRSKVSTDDDGCDYYWTDDCAPSEVYGNSQTSDYAVIATDAEDTEPTYNDDTSKSVYPPKLPNDSTNNYHFGQLSTKAFICGLDNNTIYSNANAYFLEQMYRNYKLTCANEPDAYMLSQKYRFIDVYHRGWHISPIMFNDFVRQPNNFGSPYILNYKQGKKFVWQNVVPVSQAMTNFVEKQNYNLPCNYDNKHYYYRTIEGTILRDDNIQYVNDHVRPLIMGDPQGKRVMPKCKRDADYYNTNLEYKFARKYRRSPQKASLRLNYKRLDCGFEPLWMIGLINDHRIGIYHPGEILRYNDQLTTKRISNYYIIDDHVKKYLPIYNVNGVSCLEATVAFKGRTYHYVRAQDAYMLMGNRIHHD